MNQNNVNNVVCFPIQKGKYLRYNIDQPLDEVDLGGYAFDFDFIDEDENIKIPLGSMVIFDFNLFIIREQIPLLINNELPILPKFKDLEKTWFLPQTKTEQSAIMDRMFLSNLHMQDQPFKYESWLYNDQDKAIIQINETVDHTIFKNLNDPVLKNFFNHSYKRTFEISKTDLESWIKINQELMEIVNYYWWKQ